MLNHKLLLPEGILILEPKEPLETADFEGLAREIDPYIAKHGKLPGLMIHEAIEHSTLTTPMGKQLKSQIRLDIRPNEDTPSAI